VRAYLEAHYAEPVSIDHLATLAGLSPYYLIRSFRQQVGLSPHSYQLQWQLRQAKRSLHSPAPLSDIAIATGFYDQSHLNRHFKRAFGITPGQYRQGQYR
ncbi:MAG TPA: AraC family transcriptional regulator, partial [Chroococcidiopsis sp.]